MVPLDAVITTEFTTGPDPVTHYNGFNAASVLGGAANDPSAAATLQWAAQRRLADLPIPGSVAIWDSVRVNRSDYPLFLSRSFRLAR